MKISKLIFTYLIIIYTTISFFSISFASDIYVWANVSDDTIQTNANLEENIDLNLESGSAILIETKSGQILYEHNPNEELRPASVTKIMSILLFMEAIEQRTNFIRR